MKKLLLCILSLSLACPSLPAAGPDAAQIAAIQKKVAACLQHHRHVTVETFDGRLFQGSISEAAADSFVLVYNGPSTTLRYDDVKKIKWPSELSRQLEVAAGVTAVVAGLFLAVVLLGGLKG